MKNSCSTLRSPNLLSLLGDLPLDRAADPGRHREAPKHTPNMAWRYTLLAGNLAEIRQLPGFPPNCLDSGAKIGVQIDASGHTQFYSKWNNVVKEIIPSRMNAEEPPALAQAVSKLRKTIGYSQKQLADAIGVSQSNIAKWESGKLKPPGPLCATLAKLAPIGEKEWWLLQAGVKLETDLDGDESKVRRIPLLKDAAAAGTPRAIDENEIEDTVIFPRRWLPVGGSLYVIRITGDSMSPLLEDGYLVLVDVASRSLRKLVDRMVVARDEDGGVTVKWLRQQADMFLLVPQNTSPRHPVRVLRGEDNWAIVGEVVRWIGEPPPPRKRK